MVSEAMSNCGAINGCVTITPMTEADENSNQTAETPSQSVSWTASEFIVHVKSAVWYLKLALAALVLAVIIVLITRDVISGVVIIFGAIFLGIYAARQPRQLQYVIDNRGLTIGDKLYSYDEFKSFSIVTEGAFSSLVFMPLKRFAVVTTAYYAPEDESKILAVLSARLPYEEPRRDAVDNLMRRIRF
jgi:hypothetical protein